MALSGGGPSIAGTNVLFREVHKNAWLRRLPVIEKKTGAHPKRGERVWTVFCVHDDIEPFLELYNDQKVAVAHKPDWSVSLSNTLHISPTICPQDDEFEFVISLPDNVVRLTASSWDVMMEWVDSIGAKLREMRILSPKENVYSRMPEMRAPLLPTRDPNSPLPLPPVGPLTVVPGVEPLSILDTQAEPPLLNEQNSEWQSSHHSHSNDIPVSTSSVYITQPEHIPVVYASSSSSSSSSSYVPIPQVPLQQNITVIQVKSDTFDFNSVAETLSNEVISRRKDDNDDDNNEVITEEEEEEEDEVVGNENDNDEDDVFAAPVTVTPLLPRIPNHLPRTNVTTIHQLSSHSNDEDIIQVAAMPRVKANSKRHHSFNDHSSSNSNIKPVQPQQQQNNEQTNNSNRERICSANESNTNIIEQSSTSALLNNRPNDNNIASSSGGGGSGNNINLYEHVFLATNQQQQQRVPPVSPLPVHDSSSNQDSHLLQDHNTPPPAPVVSSGRSRSGGLRPTRRRSSDSSMNTGNIPVAADRIRRLQPPPHPFRQNSSLADCDTVSTRLTLREQQVLQLRREMTHPGGVRLQLRRKDCLNSIALVDAFGAVWVAGWKQKDHPMLYNALHIGDQIISVAGVRVLNSADAQKLIRGAPSLYVAFVIRRVPYGRVFALKRDSEGQSLGLVQEGGTAEIRDVIAGSLAALHGLPPRTPSIDGLTLTTWTLTEINGRPLNLFFKENEVKDRLNAVGLDISLLVQPSDLIKQIKKQLKSMRSYKDYIVQ